MRQVVQARAGIGDADQLKQLDGAGAGGGAGDAAMARQHLADLGADREQRVERGHRVLEHHGDVAAANGFRLAGMLQQRATTPADVAMLDRAGGIDHAHHGLHGDALAGTAFADDAERLAGADLERHAPHGLDATAPGGEGDDEIVEFEQGRGHASTLRAARIWRPAAERAKRFSRSCGSAVVLTQAARRLAERMVSAIAAPGKVTSHQAPKM